jgi:hypothetical protein
MNCSAPTLLILVLDRQELRRDSGMHAFLRDYWGRLNELFGENLQMAMVNNRIQGRMFSNDPTSFVEPRYAISLPGFDSVMACNNTPDAIYNQVIQRTNRTPNYTDAIRDIREDERVIKPTNVILVSSFHYHNEVIGHDQRDWFRETNVLAVTLELDQKEAASNVFQSCEHLLYMKHVFTPDQFMFFMLACENES